MKIAAQDIILAPVITEASMDGIASKKYTFKVATTATKIDIARADRTHRIGQTRTVTVQKVIAKDTIEERILNLQEAKAFLADQVIGANGTSLAGLTREDLLELLG